MKNNTNDYIIITPFTNSQYDGIDIVTKLEDVKEVQYLQEVPFLKKGVEQNMFNYYNKNNIETKKLYALTFKDGLLWKALINDDDVQKIQNK